MGERPMDKKYYKNYLKQKKKAKLYHQEDKTHRKYYIMSEVLGEYEVSNDDTAV
jgi:hypothetical protein